MTSRCDRRTFVKQAGAVSAATTLAGVAVPNVHAGEDNTLRLALIGCGDRGKGAVLNAFNTSDQGPIKLHAVADLETRMAELAVRLLARQAPDKVDVPKDRQFVGFEAYKDAIDSLRPGDIALCTTRAYVRPVHVEYAVKKGVNVFMEKPFASDPAGLHRMRRAGQEADRNGVKIAAGLQCRHSPARAAMIERIASGDLGDVSYVRANRLAGRLWMLPMGSRANVLKEQLKFGKKHLLWVGSGHMVDFMIHQIDEACWIMGDWPVSCHGFGGREVGSIDRGQNLDVYSMEYTYPDGRKAFVGFRRAEAGRTEFATYIHGSRRAAQFSGPIHAAIVHTYKDQRISDDNIDWTPTPDAENPWDYEWIDFVAAIRDDRPYNECERAVFADYCALMGRAACHYNRSVSWDEVLGSEFQFCKNLDTLSGDSPAPVLADADGFFPAPAAGQWYEL